MGFIFSFTSLLLISVTGIDSRANDLIIKAMVILITSNLIIALYLIVFGFIPKDQGGSGNEPRNLLQQEFLNQELRFIKISEVINYQSMIDINIKTNVKVERVLRWSVVGLVVLPVLFYICTLLYTPVMIWFSF